MKTGCLVCGKEWNFTGKNGSCPGADHPGVCPACLSDARLGRLVREGATPEEALAAAGVREVKR